MPSSRYAPPKDLSAYAWLSIGAALTTIALKGWAAWMTGSVGLLSDAAESAVNLVAAVIALIVLKISIRPADEDHQFGHSKAEYFSAIVEGTMIFVAAAFIIFSAIERLIAPVMPERLGLGLAVSVVASAVNGAVARVLHRKGRREKSATLVADAKHLATDVVTSAAVLVGVGLVAVFHSPVLDAVVVVDCASVTRAGTHAPLVEALSDACVVVDHHATNPGFGAVNLIDVGAESTTTVLLSWFKHMGIHMDTPLATALYAGLVTDTGNFRWGRPAMHTMAAELIRLGVDTRATTAALMDERSVEDLALIGKVLQRVERIVGEKTTIVAIFADHDVIADEDPSMVESMVTFVCSPKDAQVGALFKEYAPGVWSVSLRSSTVDVAAVASRFGGGGHVCASGYTTQGDWRSVKASLAETLDTI